MAFKPSFMLLIVNVFFLLGAQATISSFDVFPIKLNGSPVKVLLQRTDVSPLSHNGEVIAIKGIKFNPNKRVSFDVYVSNTVAFLPVPLPAAKKGNILGGALAGSFRHSPSSQAHPAPQEQVSRQLVVKLSDILPRIGAGNKKMIILTIVPRTVTTEVEIESIEIINKSKL